MSETAVNELMGVAMVMVVAVAVTVAVAATVVAVGRVAAHAARSSRFVAASLAYAVIDAFQETLLWRAEGCVDAVILKGAMGVLMLGVVLIAAELRLNSGAVDAVGVETLASALRQLHVLLAALG